MPAKKKPAKKASPKKKAAKKSAAGTAPLAANRHAVSLLAAAREKFGADQVHKIVLRKKTHPLKQKIEKFNAAIQSDPKLKNFEFHGFANAAGVAFAAHETENLCCDDATGVCVKC